MAGNKYAKNIVTDFVPKVRADWEPKISPEQFIPVLNLDNDIVKGAFYVEVGWTLPPFARESHGESHTHDYDEVIAFFGSNPDDPHDLGAEAEIHIGGEVHTVTKSVMIFAPKGVPHGPIVFKRIDRPIFHFSCGVTGKYF
jgi:hypothetical protein